MKTILLLFLPFLVSAQTYVGMGLNTLGPNMQIGAKFKDYRVELGYNISSISKANAIKPSIFHFSVGEIISTNYFNLTPSIGFASIKKNIVVNGELIEKPSLIVPLVGLDIYKNINFGSLNLSSYYAKNFYVGIGISANFTKIEQKWWMPTNREWVSYSLYTISGIAHGYHDAIVFHHYGKGKSFCDINLSFKRKYRNFDKGDLREAYPGSKTFLVWTTDATHLSNLIDISNVTFATAINFSNIKEELTKYPKNKRLLVFLLKKIMYPTLFRAGAFETTWKTLKN